MKLNNQVLPGLNINNVTGLAQQLQLQTARMQSTPTPDQGMPFQIRFHNNREIINIALLYLYDVNILAL